MAKQRQVLNARLGLDVASKIGIDISGLFTNEDLLTPTPTTLEGDFKFEVETHKVWEKCTYSALAFCLKTLIAFGLCVVKRTRRKFFFVKDNLL